jgi:acyl-CoA synthetase (AMP-forming)/AMP-acid ligase II
MPGKVVRALIEIFPAAEQRQNYGMTESGPTGTILPPAFTLSRLGSVGLRLPLCDIRIVDETGSVLSPDVVGEIQIRSPANMLGYYRDPDATQMTLTDGWVHIGDLGREDAEGFLWYVDRLKNVINRGGLKVSSLEIEEALFRHPAVLEVAVVPMSHPSLGEDIRAFVVLRAGADVDPEALRAHCARHLSAHKIPRDIRLVGELPRNSMGKVRKTELRHMP